MKKFKTLLLTSLTAVVLCFCFLFAGCGSVTGTYKFSSMKMEFLGETIEYEVGDTVMGMGELTEDYFVVTLNEDGTAKVVEGGEYEMDGTWKEEDGKVIITMQGVDQTFEKSGSKLIMENDGAKIVLKK